MSDSDGKPRFLVSVMPYAEVQSLLTSGEIAAMTPNAFATKVSAELRAHGPAAMPDDVATWLADYLDGRVRRGRPAEPRAALTTDLYRMIYHACDACLRKEGDFPEEFVAFVREQDAALSHTFALHERAAALTSIWCHGHAGHAKTIANRISSQKI